MLYFTPYEPPLEVDYREGVKTTLCAAMREDPNAKVMHTKARHLADEKIQQLGVYEALLVDAEGYITEGSRSNVFFVRGSRLVTPPDDAVLQGIARKNILRICRRENIPVDVRRVHPNELYAFQAVFLSGTTPKVLPVQAVDDIYFNTNNRLVGFIMEKYNQYLKTYVESRKKRQQ
jgi:branched-chain amino acid aminotransferase